MQYFKPDGDLFVGDCMPFFHAGVFRLYYLLDQGHHSALAGLGGHQWAQASSEDLVSWTRHPLSIPITDEREGSICTGSVFFYKGLYHAFYATRLRDWKQHVSLAKSIDGVHFEKSGPEPLAEPPPGYNPHHYRDPCVFQDRDTGIFHMLVTALLDDFPIAGRGGCLAHLISLDLLNWDSQEPFVIPGFMDVPECADYFFWKGWHYLVFSSSGTARYRMSRRPLGPWLCPEVDTLDGGAARVMKTAAFTGDRRIGVSWVASRAGDKDGGQLQFGGNAVFRELVQHADGALGTRYPAELLPQGREEFTPTPAALTPGVVCGHGQARLDAPQGMQAAILMGVPRNFRLTGVIAGISGTGIFGLRLRYNGKRAEGGADQGYDLCLNPGDRTVRLQDQVITRVDALLQPLRLDLMVCDSLIDCCIDGRRCLIDRCPEQHGDGVLFYACNAAALFRDIRLSPL